MLNIVAIKTNKGYYISDKTERNQMNSYSSSSLAGLLINGKCPEKTWQPFWFFVENEVTSVEQHVYQPAINKRWELRDLSLADKFPTTFIYGLEEDEEFEKVRSLYIYKEDAQPNKIEPVEFTFTVIAEIDEIPHTEFSYEVINKYDRGTVTNKNVKYGILDEIITPTILIETKPCSLSSEESYKIVRKYVQQNINPKVAQITSDYDFCFAVEKMINLAEPYSYEKERKVGRKKIKDVVYVKSRNVKVFSMTHAGHKWQDYPVFEGFTGKSAADLQKNIDSFLNELIALINEPLEDCPACKGSGVKSKD